MHSKRPPGTEKTLFYDVGLAAPGHNADLAGISYLEHLSQYVSYKRQSAMVTVDTALEILWSQENLFVVSWVR